MSFDIQTFTPAGGDASRFARPEGATSGPLLLYCHGVGGSETEFGISDYNNLRAWMLSRGWAWLEANAGGPGWGNQTQRDCYRAAVQHVTGPLGYDVTDIVLVGRSMGGVVSSWLYLYDDLIGPLARGLILCSSVQSIMSAYGATFAGSVRAAYGTTDLAGTQAAIVGHDPIAFPVEDYAGKNILFQVATDDPIVSASENVLAQESRVGSVLDTVVTDFLPGDHYVTRPRWQVHSEFMESVVPTSREIYRRVGKWAFLDGKRYAIR